VKVPYFTLSRSQLSQVIIFASVANIKEVEKERNFKEKLVFYYVTSKVCFAAASVAKLLSVNK